MTTPIIPARTIVHDLRLVNYFGIFTTGSVTSARGGMLSLSGPSVSLLNMESVIM